MTADPIPLSPTKNTTRRERVLRILSDGRAHSGQRIAQRLRISRSAVWKIIRSLRGLGVEVNSSREYGYQLPYAVEIYDPTKIQQGLKQDVRNQISLLETFLLLDSTNRYLNDMLHTASSTAQLCVAEIQHAGRGRRGRTWVAPFGGGICMSLAWRFTERPPSPSTFSLVAGIATLRALRCFDVDQVQLKWPNDLVYKSHKLGGILAEMRSEASGPARIVIGLGINLRLQSHTRLDLATQQSVLVADLFDVLGDNLPSRNELVATITNELVHALIEFQKHGFAPFQDEWHQHDSLKEASVRLIGTNETVTGIARGVDVDGALLIEIQGRLHRFLSGDVSLRAA